MIPYQKLLTDSEVQYFHKCGYRPFYKEWEQIQAEGGVSYADMACWVQRSRNVYIRIVADFHPATGLFRDFRAEVLKSKYDVHTYRQIQVSASNGLLPACRNEDDAFEVAIKCIVNNDLLNVNHC